jgi:tetratricopeptide (TPR) repeat protein
VAALDEAVRGSKEDLESDVFADIPKREEIRQTLQRRLTNSGVVTAERAVTAALPELPRRPRTVWFAGAAGLAALGLWWLTGADSAPPAESPVTATQLMPTPSLPAPAPVVEAEALPTAEPAVVEPPPSATPVVAPPEPVPPRAAATQQGKKPNIAPRPAKPTPVEAPAPAPASLSIVAAPSPAELNRQAVQAMLQGRLHDAKDLYTRAARLAPNDAAAQRGLGLVHERLGNRDAAIQAYRRALVLAPQGREAESMRARLIKLGAAPESAPAPPNERAQQPEAQPCACAVTAAACDVAAAATAAQRRERTDHRSRCHAGVGTRAAAVLR